MGTKNSVRIGVEPCRSLAFGGIGVNYAAIGTGFANQSHILWIQNLTDANLWFSLNGVDDHFPVAGGSFMLLDVTSNKSNDTGFFIAIGTIVYVKRLGTPTVGSVYVTTFYGAP